jgi:hypothetical protein
VSEGDHQTPEEMLAHVGPGGPVDAVRRWSELVLVDGDLREAWPLMDEPLRLVTAQAWLWANRTHVAVTPFDCDEVAASLASLSFDHPLWPAFEETQLGEFREAWRDFNHSDWGAASRPRLIAPDYELVLFMHTGGEVLTLETETLMPSLPFVVRSTPNGWLVAAFSDQLPEPGWPPSAPRSPLIAS